MLNRRPDAGERLVDFAEQVRDQKNHVKESDKLKWREGDLQARITRTLVKGILNLLRT